jgi:PAS domain S-box-containing protein
MMVSQNYIMPTEIYAPSFISSTKVGDTGVDDMLDFDLLAEYLLDDGIPASSLLDDDFMSECISDDYETTNVESNMVSPDLRNNVVFNEIPSVESNSAFPSGYIPAPLVPNRSGIPPFVPSSTALKTTQPGVVPIRDPSSNPNKRAKLDNPQVALNSQISIEAPDSPSEGKGKSKAQVDRRRERNRILARRTRLRKKFFFESLQKELTDLQKENMALKEIVRSNLDGEISRKLLEECKANDELPDIVLEQIGDPSFIGRQDFNLVNSIKQSQQSFIITDPSLQDNPIVYASTGFIELTGYSKNDILGRNCRFLQGPETDQTAVSTLRKAIANGDDVSVTFINYTADGTPFWNKLFVAALRDAESNIVNFIGVCVKVSSPDVEDAESRRTLPIASTNDEITEEKTNADAAMSAIENAVEKAVAAAPSIPRISSPPGNTM